MPAASLAFLIVMPVKTLPMPLWRIFGLAEDDPLGVGGAGDGEGERERERDETAGRHGRSVAQPLIGLSASLGTLAACASWWWTTSRRCARPSIARCGSQGYETELAADGAEALDALADRAPDALVLDVLMPHVDGLEVCRRLRAAGDRTPVLVLTARDAVPDRVRGLDAGADDYLVKPFALEELLARLRALLRRSTRRPATASCCASPTSSSSRPRTRSAAAAGRSSSRGPSSCCSSCSCATRARCSRARRSSSACGATTSGPPPTRSRSTSATCAASSRRAASRG